MTDIVEKVAMALCLEMRKPAKTGVKSELDCYLPAARAAIRALTEPTFEALVWALPLAEMALEDHKLERLKHGHDDIGSKEGHPGLWPSEVAARDQARQTLAMLKAALDD